MLQFNHHFLYLIIYILKYYSLLLIYIKMLDFSVLRSNVYLDFRCIYLNRSSVLSLALDFTLAEVQKHPDLETVDRNASLKLSALTKVFGRGLCFTSGWKQARRLRDIAA